MSVYVCLSVREHISETTRPIFARFLCVLPKAVSRSLSGRIAICYLAYSAYLTLDCVMFLIYAISFFEEVGQRQTVLFFSRPRSEGWPHHGRLSPFISVLCHSD